MTSTIDLTHKYLGEPDSSAELSATPKLTIYDTFDEWAWQTFHFSTTAFRNRLFDRLHTASNPALAHLHRSIRTHLHDSARDWAGYDYGHGYLYQSMPALSLSGRRDTVLRLAAMGLDDIIRDRTVLDIGCNAGFMALSLAARAKAILGIDVNPYLIKIATECARYLRVEHARFCETSFLGFQSRQTFDVVLSLSNHFTYDGAMHNNFRDYLQKCRSLITPGGHLVFESHPPKFEHREARSLGQVHALLEEHFCGVLSFISTRGTPLDQGRLVYIGRNIK